MARESFFYLFY